MSCMCIDKLNEKLEEDERRAKLEVTFTMDGQMYPYMSAIYRKGTQIKERHIAIIPTFCPFCGKRYEKKAKP